VSIPLDQKLKVSDEAGATVGYLVPEKVLRDLLAERESLRARVAELEAQSAALRERAARAEEERDDYCHVIEVCAREGIVPISEEQIEQGCRSSRSSGKSKRPCERRA
jgi:hypothetical protein